MMKKINLLLAAMALFVANSAFASWGEPVFDVCDKQVRSYIEHNYEGNITSIDWVYDYDDRGSNGSEAWVRLDSCSGYVVFDLRADEMDCTIAHYGRIPNYISRVWATRDCRQ